MIYIIVYSPNDGQITGRIRSSNINIMKHYDYAIRIDEVEYQAKPELFKKVDLEKKILINKD